MTEWLMADEPVPSGYGLRITHYESMKNTGIDRAALERFIEEQIYTLPGTERHREEFSIVLTGSRAMGLHAEDSDVDLDILCPKDVFDCIQRASLEKGLIKTPDSFFGGLKEDVWPKYCGRSLGWPYYSILPLEDIERQFREYDDVALWIWSNALIIADPEGRFKRMQEGFKGYPRDVLIRKIKYRWLRAWYWAIEVYPHHHGDDNALLPAGSAILMTVNELLRFFYLVEGKPFPNDKRLVSLVGETKLGKEFQPALQEAVDLVVGKAEPELSPWERLGKAFDLVACEDDGGFYQACASSMLEAGVDPKWVEADFENIHELLTGSLGPPP